MKHLLFTLITALMCLSSSANALQPRLSSLGEQVLTPQQITQDVNLLADAYSRLHPGYTRYTSAQELSSAWQEIKEDATANNGMKLSDFYLQIQKTLTLIKCDHTKANLPKAMSTERDQTNVYLPFKWTWLEGRAFVTIPDAKANLQVFDEIISINGETIGSIVEQVQQYIPYDGDTIWSRNSGISDSKEFKGGAVDHFGALLGPVLEQATLVVKRNSGEQKNITLQRINYKEWDALASSKTTAANFKDALTFKRINENTAYLSIDTFVNYRHPVEPQSVYQPIFKAIKEEGINTLILDLRNNGGGSTDASQGLLANLITEDMAYKVDMFTNTLSFKDLRPYLSTWEKSALDPWRLAFSKNDNGTFSLRSWFTDDLDTIEPSDYAFGGKIIALTSNNNSSGSTNLLSVIHATGRATLVGEKTGGSAEGVTAGVLFTLSLPASKITTRIPYFQFKNNVKHFTKGLGLTPEIEAPMTVSAFLANADPAYTAALALAKRNAIAISSSE